MNRNVSVSRLISYIRHIVSRGDGVSHFYQRERHITDDQFTAFVCGLTDADPETVLATRQQLIDDRQFHRAIEEQLRRTEFRPNSLHRNWREVLYVIVALATPSNVVETGVYDGLSSAYILKALSDSGRGELISIDIGNTEPLPDDLDVQPGWAVPDWLHDRWTLKFGDSKDILPKVADANRISMFLHDSLHTEEHMRFEFTIAVGAMSSGAVFLSDNVSFNDAFETFAAEFLVEPHYLQNTTQNYDYDGNPVDDRLGGGVIS